MWNPEKVKEIVESHKVVCFGKGTKLQPMCGFTHRAIQILAQTGADFEVVNIFDDPAIRPSLVQVTNWPTTPQVFIGGEFVGGSDIVLEMFESGELQKKLSEAGAIPAQG
ncbi:MAG: Grx4 family monothiol glutaredoxin [Planctomycetota bacterium]